MTTTLKQKKQSTSDLLAVDWKDTKDQRGETVQATFKLPPRDQSELSWKLIEGDALRVARSLPDNSVHLIVTSVPYWLLRDYGVAGQLGLEETVEEWVKNQVRVFREFRRVLHPSGSIYLNCGDCFYSSRSFAGPGKNTDGVFTRVHDRMTNVVGKRLPKHPVLKPKDLIMQPDRLAIGLQEDGWWIRGKIIWWRTNGTPQSPPDRPPIDFELIHVLTKKPKGYFYDRYSVWCPPPPLPNLKALERSLAPFVKRGPKSAALAEKVVKTVLRLMEHKSGLKGHFLRSVWPIPSTKGFVDSKGRKHAATFPVKLVEPCIKAGSSEKGVCPKCLEPWKPITSKARGGSTGKAWHDHDGDLQKGNAKKTSSKGYEPPRIIGWRAACACKNKKGKTPKPIPATVLDPYNGTATTGVIALGLGRNYIGVDLSPDYIGISKERLKEEFPKVARTIKRFDNPYAPPPGFVYVEHKDEKPGYGVLI